MHYEIDQSGKIEETSKNTVLCISNSKFYTIILKAKTKRELQNIFRKNGQGKNYILITFSVLLALLIKEKVKVGYVVIDKEYYGKESIIKTLLLEILKYEKQIPDIHFGLIGKRSKAHYICKSVATNVLNANEVITLAQILKEIKKTEVGKRLKNT